MELKVWVEGIQRVVCGVTETTTCQDVVYALAHATGQTGRFTLVEKWRHSERLLPPQDHPLKVLTKWGEYAGDVQLILRRSSDKKGIQNNNNNNKNCTATQQIPAKKSPSDLRSFSPPNSISTVAQNSSIPNQNKELKKSLTFSGSHGSSGSTSSGSSSGQSTPLNSNSGVNATQAKTEHGWDPQGKGRDPSWSGRPDLPRGIVKGIPQERVSPARPRQPPSYDEAISRSSRHHMSSQLSSFSPERDSPSSKRRHLAAGPRVSPLAARVSPNRTADVFTHHVTLPGEQYKRDSALESPLASSPKDFHWTSEKPKVRKNLIGEFKKDTSPKLDKERKSENVVVLLKETEDPQYRDLMRLVSLQREKLTNQNAELSQYDTEIVYWEGKLQEQESKLVVLEEETRRLERLSSEQEQELSCLEQGTEQSLEAGHQDERLLRSKLALARAQLSACDTQLAHARQRLRHLADEITEEHRKSSEMEREARERDEQSHDLKDQMTLRTQEQHKQKELLSDLEQNLLSLEQNLLERQSQLEKLTVELREANLQALSMTIADDIKCLSEGNFHNRSGSTRRIMGSPRQLENAVPTSKNPHGVWV